MQLEEMKNELSILNIKLKEIEEKEDNSYTARIAKSFHLGMVGGSGNSKNIHKLNAKREREFDKSISEAKGRTELYSKRDLLVKQIEDIESGKTERLAVDKFNRNQKLAEWWKSLKAGDNIKLYTNNEVTIKSIRGKTLTSTFAGCKYSAIEIIGKEAAKLL